VQLKCRTKRVSRSVTLEGFVTEVASLRSALENVPQPGIDEYLANARSFRAVENTKSGTELILGLPERLVDLRTALHRIGRRLKAEESAEINIEEGQLAKVAYLLNHVTGPTSGTMRAPMWLAETGQAMLELHPTVKPVPLVADAIKDCSKRGGLVFGPVWWLWQHVNCC
jgi:hypothetical protein